MAVRTVASTTAARGSGSRLGSSNRMGPEHVQRGWSSVHVDGPDWDNYSERMGISMKVPISGNSLVRRSEKEKTMTRAMLTLTALGALGFLMSASLAEAAPHGSPAHAPTHFAAHHGGHHGSFGYPGNYGHGGHYGVRYPHYGYRLDYAYPHSTYWYSYPRYGSRTPDTATVLTTRACTGSTDMAGTAGTAGTAAATSPGSGRNLYFGSVCFCCNWCRRSTKVRNPS